MSIETTEKQLNILEMMGYKREHAHKSIDSTAAIDITIPTVDNNLQYDSPTITRVTKQFAENIKRLSEYIFENAEAMKTTNLSNYITTNLNDENGLNKIFVAPPCTLTSQRTLDVQKCIDIQPSETISNFFTTFMLENSFTKSKFIVGVSNKLIIRMNITNVNKNDEFIPQCDPINIYKVEDDVTIYKAGFADSNKFYIYVITNNDIRLFKVADICNENFGSIEYSNIVDFKNSYSDNKHRYDDNIIVEDIFRKNKIIDLIVSGNFNDFVDKYFKLGEFPKNVLEAEYFSENPVEVYDIGVVTGKYGIYLIQCYSSKPKNINEFEIDNGIGSLHIRCLDNKPVKNAFFYEENNVKYLVAINGLPEESNDLDYDAKDNLYKGLTVFRINESSSAAESYEVPTPETVWQFHSTINENEFFYTISKDEAKTFLSDSRWNFDGGVFQAFSKQIVNTIPVFRLYSSSTNSYAYTLDEDKSLYGFTNPEVAFYVFKNEYSGEAANVISIYEMKDENDKENQTFFFSNKPLYDFYNYMAGDYGYPYIANETTKNDKEHYVWYVESEPVFKALKFETQNNVLKFPPFPQTSLSEQKDFYDENKNGCIPNLDYEKSTLTVWGFLNIDGNNHFYTTDKAERDNTIQNDSSWRYIGEVFDAYTDFHNVNDLTPFYRYYNQQTNKYACSTGNDTALINNGFAQNTKPLFYAYSEEKENCVPVYELESTGKGKEYTIDKTKAIGVGKTELSPTIRKLCWVPKPKQQTVWRLTTTKKAIESDENYKNAYFFTFDEEELIELDKNPYWTIEKAGFQAYVTDEAEDGLIPIYRYKHDLIHDYVYSSSKPEDGHLKNAIKYKYIRVAFYAWPQDTVTSDGTKIAIYRYFSETFKHHVNSIQEPNDNSKLPNSDGCGDTFKYEGISFVCPKMIDEPVWRFYAKKFGAHFYTISKHERNGLMVFGSNWILEGIAFNAYNWNLNPSEMVHVNSYYNKETYDHLYTIFDPVEGTDYFPNTPNYKFEGIRFYAFNENLSRFSFEGKISQVFRFYNNNVKQHFYTISVNEKNRLVGTNWIWENGPNISPPATVFKAINNVNEIKGSSSSINLQEIIEGIDNDKNNTILDDFIILKSNTWEQTPADGYLKYNEYASTNINQILGSHGINGSYVSNLYYKKCQYINLNNYKLDGFLLKFSYTNPNNSLDVSDSYWFVGFADQNLCNIIKTYDRHEFNCLAEYKIKQAAYYNNGNSILFSIKDIGLVKGDKDYDKNGNVGFRFRVIKSEESFGNEKIIDIFVMNRCFVVTTKNKIYFIISDGEFNEIQIGRDIYTNVNEIQYGCSFEESNVLSIGYNTNIGESKLALVYLKYKLKTDLYTDIITENLSELISEDFMSKDNSISKKIEEHIATDHAPDTIIYNLNKMLKELQNKSLLQATADSDNLHISEIVLNYPNHGDDFSFVETDDNSTNIYGRINSNTVNSNPSLTTLMKRNSNAITYYDTVKGEDGTELLSTNKLTYSVCKLSSLLSKVTVNVPSTGTYYVDNILGWSCGNRTGSALLRKNLNDGYIQGKIEDCTTKYQLVLNRVFFNVKNILNVTAQLTSVPLKIYSNKNEFDVRHYGMYDSPMIAPLNLNSLNANFKYDLSNTTDDEITLTFSIFGGDALQINILIENYD